MVNLGSALVGEKLKERIRVYKKVRRSYKNGLYTLRELGRKYKFSHQHIKEMLKGKNSAVMWIKNIGGDPVGKR